MFPSREWCEEAVRLVNQDPESALAGAGWDGDFGIVIEAEAGKLPKPFAIHVTPKNGRLEKLSVLRDPDELEEIEPAYLARAPYSIWKGLLLGTVDPVEAVLKRQIRMTGDLQPVMERVRYKGVADRALAQIQTTFVDEG
jgi:putative sterol carrier protein